MLSTRNNIAARKIKAEAPERLAEIIKAVMVIQGRRRSTKPTRGSQKKHLNCEIKHGWQKALRKILKINAEMLTRTLWP